MLFGKRKHPNKKVISILKEGVRLREELADTLEKNLSELESLTTEEKLNGNNLGWAVALNYASIDIFPRVNNPDYSYRNHKKLFPLVREYITNLKQRDYSRAIEAVNRLNRYYL